jgi:hypothetical protein
VVLSWRMWSCDCGCICAMYHVHYSKYSCTILTRWARDKFRTYESCAWCRILAIVVAQLLSADCLVELVIVIPRMRLVSLYFILSIGSLLFHVPTVMAPDLRTFILAPVASSNRVIIVWSLGISVGVVKKTYIIRICDRCDFILSFSDLDTLYFILQRTQKWV